jgi:DNA-binding MarR family transcriptional regulator
MASDSRTKTRPKSRSTEPSLPVDSPERRRLPLLLRRCWFNLNQTFRRRIAHTGVTPDQFTVMRTVLEGHAAGLTQSELTRLMSSDPNTMASLLERMESLGYVERKVHEKDRRAYRIHLSPQKRNMNRCADHVLCKPTSLSVLPPGKREEIPQTPRPRRRRPASPPKKLYDFALIRPAGSQALGDIIVKTPVSLANLKPACPHRPTIRDPNSSCSLMLAAFVASIPRSTW